MNFIFQVFWPAFVGLIISAFSIPVIIRVADEKHLMDEPDGNRKIHTARTPTLGGISIFAGTIFAYSTFSDYLRATDIKFMIPGLILLFFAGVKDDILTLSAWKKLLVQMVCSFLIVTLGDLRLTSLWGMFGFGEIPVYVGIAITFVLMVGLINAFNLIDGVNGLAGSLGLVASVTFGAWFYLVGEPTYAILSFALAGSLMGFLYYNFHSGRIFMGDTGSMVVGFIIAILTIRFVEFNRQIVNSDSSLFIKAAPAFAIGTVLIPLFDMVRLFFQRILANQSPFTADRRHIHHILLDLGMRHKAVTGFLTSLAIVYIVLAYLLRDLRSLDLTVLLCLFNGLITIGLTLLRRKRLGLKIKSLNSNQRAYEQSSFFRN